jgi:hypothetical protein
MRAAVDRHRAASDAGDFEAEHCIYCKDAVLNTRSQASETAVDATYRSHARTSRVKSVFAVRGALWVTEYILTYDGKPS